LSPRTVEESIDNAAIGRRQLAIVGLCGLLAMVDGFDAQAMAYAAPALAAELKIVTSDFGLVFGAGSFGSLAGVLVQGPLGDRFGRKTVMLAAFALVTAASLLNVQATTLAELIALRFIAGFGLGGALPNLFAITAEYTPRRRRSTFVTAMFCGVPLGATLGGLVAASVLQSHDWRVIFYFGGIAPLVLATPAWFFLPESASYLATRPDARERLGDALRRLNIEPPAQFIVGTFGKSAPRSTVFRLFDAAHIRGTALLSAIAFLGLLVSISLTNWLPLILNRAGLTIGMAVIGGVFLSGGGMIGALFFAILGDRFDMFRVLAPAYVVAALSIATIGAVPPDEIFVMAAIFFTGFFFIGSQMCLPTLVTSYYPSALRATGIGWTMGAGRIGAIVGPALTGVLVANGISTSNLFYIASGVVLLTVAALLPLGPRHRRVEDR